jgi:hypothetical protein
LFDENWWKVGKTTAEETRGGGLFSCFFTALSDAASLSMASPAETAAIAAQPVVLKSSSSSVDGENELSYTKERSGSEASSLYDYKNGAALAPAGEEPPSVGLAFLQSLGLKKRAKVFDLDAVRLARPLRSIRPRLSLLCGLSMNRSQRRNPFSTVLSANSSRSTLFMRTRRSSTQPYAGRTGRSVPSLGSWIGRSWPGCVFVFLTHLLILR